MLYKKDNERKENSAAVWKTAAIAACAILVISVLLVVGHSNYSDIRNTDSDTVPIKDGSHKYDSDYLQHLLDSNDYISNRSETEIIHFLNEYDNSQIATP